MTPQTSAAEQDAHHVQLNDIALFVEVARRKSFSLAARALDMPTSTLSRRINQLEQAIGMRLINRNTRRLELTDAGSVYLQRCQGLIDEARLAHEQLLALSDRPKGRLSISMPYSLAIWLLPEALRGFTNQYPELDCEFDLSMRSSSDSHGTPYDVILRFGRDQVDAGADVNAVVQEVQTLDSYLYASTEYLERHGEPRSPADLAQHQCLRTAIDEAYSHWNLHNGVSSMRVHVDGHVAGNNISVMGTLAGLGMGITRLPYCPALDPVIKRNSLHRVLPDWTVDPMSVYAVFPSNLLPAKTRAFMEFIMPMLKPADEDPAAA
ncbi:LysR family transcriptional regulator [Bordetella ansorpii]|uniref:LysR family transcriptional regulator n=1 Tax=Bordetella ansorpii TaxID=288768 RepID=A0A157LHW4_9BORD|nr:LysR family transcriptional regulator [Bordetella ansorpii]SAH96365.1 LysR family transcriptional regulator [Bordetella ansorpii]